MKIASNRVSSFQDSWLTDSRFSYWIKRIQHQQPRRFVNFTITRISMCLKWVCLHWCGTQKDCVTNYMRQQLTPWHPCFSVRSRKHHQHLLLLPLQHLQLAIILSAPPPFYGVTDLEVGKVGGQPKKLMWGGDLNVRGSKILGGFKFSCKVY